jgi:hypothetical protein
MRFKKDRCAELLSVKIRTAQREFLEEQAIAKGTSLCDITRELIDEAMKARGIA